MLQVGGACIAAAFAATAAQLPPVRPRVGLQRLNSQQGAGFWFVVRRFPVPLLVLAALLLLVPPAAHADETAPVASAVATPQPAPASQPAAPASQPATAAPELHPATAAEVLAAVHDNPAKVVLVNLWATWCTPCRQEFPDLLRFWRATKDRGVALVLVSGDFPNETRPAKDFLASQGVDFPSFLKNEGDEAFINGFDPAWSGALPATFVYIADAKRVHSFLGPVTYESLEKVVTPLLETKP